LSPIATRITFSGNVAKHAETGSMPAGVAEDEKLAARSFWA